MELENLKDEDISGDILPKDMYENASEIVFENVRFSYNEDSKISVMNFSFKIG